MLEENKCDIAARTSITRDQEKYLFTEPIVLDKQVLIQRTEQPITGPNHPQPTAIWPVRPSIFKRFSRPAQAAKLRT